MVWIDYLIICIIGFSAFVSLIRGFVREALSLIVWASAFLLASHYYPYVSVWLTMFDDKLMRDAFAIALLFATSLFFGGLINHVLGSFISKTGLSGPDRALGVCFGALRGIVVVTALLLFFETFTPFPDNRDWQDSELIPHFSNIIDVFFDYLNTADFLQV